ncbi:MAG: bifunctional hydroxymethylpyrimidine kinase/phosphomethylpyrimidine kinase [Deltaproteobacteria bacterium]|nr:bifunctional hydroxymethylpyrimidine kinase/phosphomethylpyrimidine kinase [Deltaproteobacteria bacterium]
MKTSVPARGERAPAVLVIAGSDPSGGAGMQGDLATLAAVGAFGMAVPTALTVQSRRGVRRAQALPPAAIEAGIRAVLTRQPVDAIKIGMLHDAAVASAVARALARFRGSIVIDPVLRPTRGRPLARGDLVGALLRALIPRAAVVTPNLEEASALCRHPVRDIELMLAAGCALCEIGAACALVKGGHLAGDAIDVVVDARGCALIWGARRRSPRTHGTGCALSTLIAAGLARGLGGRDACLEARRRLDRALRGDHPVGRGSGSVAHRALR